MKRLVISGFAIALALSIPVLPVIAAEIRNGFAAADQNGIWGSSGEKKSGLFRVSYAGTSTFP